MSRAFVNGVVAVQDDAGTELDPGWLLVDAGRIKAVGSGEPPEADERVDLHRAVVTPGLINTHHHLYLSLIHI